MLTLGTFKELTCGMRDETRILVDGKPVAFVVRLPRTVALESLRSGNCMAGNAVWSDIEPSDLASGERSGVKATVGPA